VTEEELCVVILVTGAVWAGLSAEGLAISIRMEEGWKARVWGATFAVSSLCAAYCFGRLM
jgi:hypothetical protein